MSEREDLGHAPEETHDRRFAPVNRGADARGRTVPGRDVPCGGGERAREGVVSGTGVPGVHTGTSGDALPPDEEGVRYAERTDASRRHRG